MTRYNRAPHNLAINVKSKRRTYEQNICNIEGSQNKSQDKDQNNSGDSNAIFDAFNEGGCIFQNTIDIGYKETQKKEKDSVENKCKADFSGVESCCIN